MPSRPREADEIARALTAVLGDVLGDVVVSDVSRMPGGSSRETWSATAVNDAGPRRLVLRRDPPGAPPSGMVLEGTLLAQASLAGVPVPAVVASGGPGSALGSAFVVVDHVEGETLPKRILRQADADGSGEALAAQCGSVLAAVHDIDPAAVPGLAGGDQLEQLRGLHDHLGHAHPAFELAFRHLGATRPARTGECVVHGDFRNGNLIVGPDGIRAVLDWELAHRGDPLEDLGWLCVKAWRFGAAPPVGGLGSIDSLVRGYQGAGGAEVDREALQWWVMLGTLRWGIICIVQAMTHITGAVQSVELAAIGRRVCEVEWDLLELMP